MRRKRKVETDTHTQALIALEFVGSNSQNSSVLPNGKRIALKLDPV